MTVAPLGGRKADSLSLDHMRAFLAVVECGSQVAAARRLKVAYPTVWRYVARVQEHFGGGLFEPGLGTRLSVRGQLVADSVRSALAELEMSRSHVERPILRIGFIRIMRPFVERALREAAKKTGAFDVDVRLFELTSERHTLMLRRRELDVAVCYAVDSDLDTKHGIDVDAIARQPCCLVVPESAYVRGRLVVGKLAGLSYAHVPAHLSPELTAKSLRWLADNRIAPQKRIECRFGTEIIAYAASGFGYGILPALWRATHHEAVVFAAIPDLPYEARINAYSLPHVRQWTAVFRRALRAVTKELLGKYPASSRPKVSKSVPLVSVAGERRGTSPRAPTIRTD